MIPDLTQDEQAFRARLLQSAELLDEPQELSNALSALTLRQAKRERIFSGALYRLGGAVAILAAAAALAISYRAVAVRGPSQVQVSPERLPPREPSSVAKVPQTPLVLPPKREPLEPSRKLPEVKRVSVAKLSTKVHQGDVAHFSSDEPPPVLLDGLRGDVVGGQRVETGREATGALPQVSNSTSALVAWDGDRHGLTASGWTGPENVADALKVEDAVGFQKSRGLRYCAEGGGWMGFGWNLFAWYPSTAGIDLSAYRSLSFRMRIETPSADLAPDPKGWLLTLRSSGGVDKRATGTVRLGEQAPKDLANGAWHQIRLPLASLLKESRGFDLKTFWEFGLGHWANERRRFIAYVDDITFEL